MDDKENQNNGNQIRSSRPQIYSLINKQKLSSGNQDEKSITNSSSLKLLKPLLSQQNYQSARVNQRTRNNENSSGLQHHNFISTQNQSELQTTTKTQTKISHFDKIEQLKFEFMEAHQAIKDQLLDLSPSSNINYIQEVILERLEKVESINLDYESLCENLASQLSNQQDKNKTLRDTLKGLKNESTQLIQIKEKEFLKTQKRYERSLGDIKSCYDRSSRQVNENLNELELMAQEMKQSRAKLGMKRSIYMRTVEQEICQDSEDVVTLSGRINIQNIRRDIDQFHRVSSVEQLEQTSKFSILLSNRNYMDGNHQTIDNENKCSARGQNQNSFLEKTTPRGNRPYNQKQSQQPTAMIKNYVKVPKLPLNNKAKLNKDKSLDVMNSIDLSNIVKKESEQSTNIKKQLIDSNNKNDESVYAPAFIIGEKDPEWDSFLDDTKVDLNQEEISFYQKDYLDQLRLISNPDQRINKIDPSLLKSQSKILHDCSTPDHKKELRSKLSHNKKNSDSLTKSTRKQNLLKESGGQNTRDTHKIYGSFQSNQKSNKKRYPDSSNKKYKFTDAKLQEILDVSNAFITQSPLPSFPTDEKQYPGKMSHLKGCQDVQLEDIMNVKSLSISMRTATDAGAYMNEENNSFSEIKKSNFKFKTNNTNQSCIEYQEEDSMCQDYMQHQTLDHDRNHIRNINKEVFNIIDENNNNGELSGNILEESSSSYSKTGNIQFQGTQQTLNSQFSGNIRSNSVLEYEEFKQSSIHENDKINSGSKQQLNIQPESFKSTAVMAAIGENKECLNSILLSCNQSQIPTPAFNQRQKSLNTEYIDQTERSQSNNDFAKRKGNYLLSNHSKLIERITEKCDLNTNDIPQSTTFNTLNHHSTDKDISKCQSQTTHSFVSHQNLITSNGNKNAIFHFVPRSNSANTNNKVNKIKLNFVKKGAQHKNTNAINQSMITVIEKKNLKIPMKSNVFPQQISGQQSVQHKKTNFSTLV